MTTSIARLTNSTSASLPSADSPLSRVAVNGASRHPNLPLQTTREISVLTAKQVIARIDGQSFCSLREIASFYGFPLRQLTRELRKGVSILQAISATRGLTTKPTADQGMVIGGLRFGSIQAACRHFGVPKTTYQKRIARGYSLEQALGLMRAARAAHRNSMRGQALKSRTPF